MNKKMIRLLALVLITTSICQATEWVSLGGNLRSAAFTTSTSRVSQIDISEATAEQVSLRTSLSGFFRQTMTMEDGNTYSSVTSPGAGKMPVGHPDLPAFGQWVLVPNGTEIEISVEPGAAVLMDSHSIPPLQPPQIESSEVPPPFTKDKNIYESNHDYPAVFARTDDIRMIRGQSLALVWLYPYRWNPVTEEMTIYPDLTVTISFVGNGSSAEQRLRTPAFDNQFRRMAPNADAVLALPPITHTETSRKITSTATDDVVTAEGCNLLIICPDHFTGAANTLATWKRKRGIATAIRTTSETGNTAEDIRNYISNTYSNWIPAPSYVLLIGDAEYIPPYYGTVATDLYYADMTSPYDRIADLAIGRWPVDTASQAMNCALRTVEYERTPPSRTIYPHYYSNATQCGAFQDGAYENPLDGYANRRFAKTSEDVRNFLLNKGYNSERIYATYNGYDSSAIFPANWNQTANYIFENDISGAPIPTELLKPVFAWDGDSADIQSAVNQGTFLVTHRDHGNRNGWGEPRLERSNVDALNNGILRPIVFTINCQTAWFDNETDGSGSKYECFSEHWIRHASGGSIGLMGATRNSYSGLNDRLVWGWMDAIWPDFIEYQGGSYGNGTPLYRMGDVLNYGRTYLLTKYSTGSTVDIALEEYVWIGDPTLEIWTGAPGDLAVSHPSTQPKGAITFDVNIDQDGALVCCMFNGRILGTATAAGGIAQVVFDSVPDSTGPMDITVTCHNHLPYEGTCTIFNAGLPSATTDGTVSNLSPSSIAISGSVVSQGSSAVTSRGICWGTSPYPTTAHTKVACGSGMGDFTATLYGLANHRNYYARAYAVNASGTSYGDTIPFRTIYLHRFEWDAVAETQYPGIPFPVQITALNQYGAPFDFFTDTIALSGMADQEGDSSIVITECGFAPDFIEIENASGQTTNTANLIVAVSASYTDINKVNNSYWQLPTSMAANEVAYKTDNIDEAYWGANILWNPEDNGWAMVIDKNDGSVIDFIAWGWSHAEISTMSPIIHGHTITVGSEFSSDGTPATGSSSLQRQGNKDQNTAADFAWVSPESKGTHNSGLIYPLFGPPAPIPVDPVLTGSFAHGSWSGNITLAQGAENAYLLADDGSGHIATSSIFNVASGADADTDNIPDWWEIMYFGNCVNCIPTNHSDSDRHNNWQEYIAGTNPTNGNSYFMVTNYIRQADSGNFVVEWVPVAGRTYTVQWKEHLPYGSFGTAESDIEFPRNSYTDTLHSAKDNCFYQIEVKLK